MKRITATIAIALLAACGAPQTDDRAALALGVTVDDASRARMLRFAAAVTDPEAVLEEYRPARLQVMVCDDIPLSELVRNFCTAEAGDYNARQIVDITAESGSVTVEDIPSGKEQVIVVQGLSGSGLLTYQGFVSAPAIEPRGSYAFDVALTQIRYPPLTAAAIPVLTTPSPSEVTYTTTEFTIKGTRELETLMRVTLHSAFGLGSPRVFEGSEGGFYVEREKNGKLEWELTLDIPNNGSVPGVPRTSKQVYAISFQAARTFDTSNFSKEVRFMLVACGQNEAASCPAP